MNIDDYETIATEGVPVTKWCRHCGKALTLTDPDTIALFGDPAVKTWCAPCASRHPEEHGVPDWLLL